MCDGAEAGRGGIGRQIGGAIECVHCILLTVVIARVDVGGAVQRNVFHNWKKSDFSPSVVSKFEIGFKLVSSVFRIYFIL